MITISVCMIVKNEERVLARCLDCLKDIADEIVIADTGSTDRTKEIAEKYTDRIYDFEWQDDFSAARNFAFGLCTMDYIYSADADEILDRRNTEKLKRLKETLLPEIEIVQMLYSNQLEYNTTYNYDSELRPKLYKRLRPFVWEGRLHEAVRLEPVIFDSDIEIIHKPESLHSGRDFSMFRRAVEAEGELSGHLHEMYARELAVSGEDGDFIKAGDYFLKAAEKSADPEALKADFYILVRAARASGNPEDMFRYMLRAVALGTVSETAYEIGEYYRSRGETGEAVMWYYNAAFETEPILNAKYGDEYPKLRLEELGWQERKDPSV